MFGQDAGLDTSANVSKTMMERALDSVRSRLGESDVRGTEDMRAFAREYACNEKFQRAHQLATEAGASLSKSTELSGRCDCPSSNS